MEPTEQTEDEALLNIVKNIPLDEWQQKENYLLAFHGEIGIELYKSRSAPTLYWLKIQTIEFNPNGVANIVHEIFQHLEKKKIELDNFKRTEILAKLGIK